MYLDGGPLGTDGVALPSTIVDFTQAAGGAILRRGALSVEQIRDVCPDVIDLDEDAAPGPPTPGPIGEQDEPVGEGTGQMGEPEPDSGPGDAEPADYERADSSGVGSEPVNSGPENAESGESGRLDPEPVDGGPSEAQRVEDAAADPEQPDRAEPPALDTGR